MELDNQPTENMAQTLANELKQPISIAESERFPAVRRVALPPGWSMKEYNDEKLQPAPCRKTANVSLQDDTSFTNYLKKHGSLANSSIWCHASYSNSDVSFTAILNDHGDEENQPAWRDHLATFKPKFSEEWVRWINKNKQPFSQPEFAAFIEENMKDIASVEGSPSGGQMLEMALNFEANQDMRFKSAVRLQSGGINMSFVQTDDAQTIAQMQMFDRFTLGLPVFWSGDAYQVNARLRYRQREGKLTFYYELVRQDKVLEDATLTLINKIRESTGNPFFFGDPFAK